MAAASSSPFISGIAKSVITRSNLPLSKMVKASLALPAVSTWCPSKSSIIFTASQTKGSSSTTRIRRGGATEAFCGIDWELTLFQGKSQCRNYPAIRLDKIPIPRSELTGSAPRATHSALEQGQWTRARAALPESESFSTPLRANCGVRGGGRLRPRLRDWRKGQWLLTEDGNGAR